MKWVIGIIGLIWKLYILVIFSITAILFYPFIKLLLNSEENKRKAYRCFVIWSWTFRVLGFYFTRHYERKSLPKAPFMIIANHASYLDIFLLPSLFPKSHFIFLGKSEILGYPIIRAYFKNFNIPVYRDNRLKAARSVVQAVEACRNGWSIVVFPEGGIPDQKRPYLGNFKLGAFQIAKSAQLPIVCLTFVNNFKLFSEPEELLGPARPGVAGIYRHAAISLEEVNSKTAEELSELSRNMIKEALCRHYPDLK